MALTIKAVLISLVVGILGGLGIGYKLYHAAPAAVTEKAAPTIAQSDGSTVLQRAQTGSVPVVPAQIPKGYHEVREVQLTVQGRRTTALSQPNGAPQTKETPLGTASAPEPAVDPCAPVHLKLDLVQSQKGDERVVASSQDGDILGGMDVPVQAQVLAQQKALNWRVGALYGAFPGGSRAIGTEVQRDVGPFYVSAGFLGSKAAFIGAGIKF